MLILERPEQSWTLEEGPCLHNGGAGEGLLGTAGATVGHICMEESHWGQCSKC